MADEEKRLREMAGDLLKVDLDLSHTQKCIAWMLNENEHLKASILLAKGGTADAERVIEVLRDEISWLRRRLQSGEAPAGVLDPL